MTKHFSILITLAILFLATFSSQAAVLTLDGNRPMFIEGLELGGVTFDVAVRWGKSYDDVFGNEEPYFFNSTYAERRETLIAISDVFLGQGVQV